VKFSKLLFAFVAILYITVACNHSSKIASKTAQEETKELSEFVYTEPLNIPEIDQTGIDLEKITYIEKIGEIKESFSKEEYNFFANITDLCVDKNDNLYVADSKLHKIFKFNKDQEFLLSFGWEGQGPGEFVGRLRMSVGNDNNIYITDLRSFKLSVYSLYGEFIRQFRLPMFLYDMAIANSQGDIYLLS